MGKQEVALKVDHVGMKFNLSKEKVDNLKEYFIKFVKKGTDISGILGIKGRYF